MIYYPVFLDLENRHVLVVGGGSVALQKLAALLDAEARIVLVAPQALPAARDLAQAGKITWHQRPYQAADLEGCRLVIAATDDPAVQESVARDCRARGIWVNVVDVTPLCDFIAPAVVRQGPVQLAVSTGGTAPALAKYLRRKLEVMLGPEYGAFAGLVGRRRADILKLPKERRTVLWEKLVQDDFFRDIREKGIAQAERRLDEWLQ